MPTSPTIASQVKIHGILLSLCLLAYSEPDGLAAQTRLHRDLGGVTIRVGNVLISSRLDGRTVTAVRVGRSTFYNSNFGLTGLSYQSHTGRLDALWNGKLQRNYASFTPARYVGPTQARSWVTSIQVAPSVEMQRHAFLKKLPIRSLARQGPFGRRLSGRREFGMP